MAQLIGAYLFKDKPDVEKAMRILQGVRASNFMVSNKTLTDLMTACWLANKVEDADLLLQDMISANYTVDAKVIRSSPVFIIFLNGQLSRLFTLECFPGDKGACA